MSSTPLKMSRPARVTMNDGTHETGREIDLAEQQHEDLGHAEHHEHGALLEQVDDVAGGQELRVEPLEHDHDDDQGQDDRQDAAVTALEPQPDAAGVLRQG